MVEIMLVGEAWGEKEEEQGRPFVGTSGWLLDQFLAQAGIARRDCYVTNVFNLRPRPSNDIKNLCGPRTSGIPNMPELTKGKYVRAEYAPELERLYDEIKREQPNIVVALGATASWALLRSSGIKAIRGATALTHSRVTERLGRSCKVLPTYHPAAVARQWNLRPIIISDLDKARRESTNPDYQPPSCDVWIRPTLEDLPAFADAYFPGELISCDIETRQDQITCIGFSTAQAAIVIPLFDESGQSYWNTTEEKAVWNYVRLWLATYPTVFQNGMYDITFLWRRYGIPAPRAAEDTMLMHHAFQPEMEKGLGFLGSIYTDFPSWKYMSKGKKHD